MARLNKQLSRRRGVALVEMAVVFPLLLFVTIAAAEFGFVLLRFQDVQRAAWQGARAGSLCFATNAKIDAAVNQAMASAGITSGYSRNITSTATAVTVTVSMPYTGEIIPFLDSMTLDTQGIQLQRQATWQKENCGT